MSKPIVAVIFLITSFAAASPSKASADDPSNRVVENLHALAQLYGVVRWFHPQCDLPALIQFA